MSTVMRPTTTAAPAVIQTAANTKVSKLAKSWALLSSGVNYAWNSRFVSGMCAIGRGIGSASRYALAHSPELMAFAGVAISVARLFHFYMSDRVATTNENRKTSGFFKQAYVYINSHEGHTTLPNQLILPLTVGLVAISRLSK